MSDNFIYDSVLFIYLTEKCMYLFLPLFVVMFGIFEDMPYTLTK